MIDRLRRAAGQQLRGRHVDVDGLVELPDIHRDNDERVEYIASARRWLPRVLPRREVSTEDVLVDFGSGKGWVVYQAARRYRLARVVGVEISPELQRIARANVERNRDRLKCSDVELVTTDVLDFEIPDDMTIAYFFNPFVGEVFQAVLVRICASLDRVPRRLRVVYANPQMLDRVLATGRFEIVRRVQQGGTEIVLLEGS